MPDYSNGKIYKIHRYQTDLVYYGSTTQTLCRRLSKHKTNIKCGCNVTSKQILEYDDAMITLIELFPCGSKSELLSRERWYIENNQCVNKCIPGRTRAEYTEANRDKISQQGKVYREANYDRIKSNREANRDGIKKYNKHINSPFGHLCKTYGIFN